MTGKKIPVISVEDMRRIDRIIDKQFGLEIVQLMENAGRTAASLTRRLLRDASKKKICILAGRGNNGGDGFAAARFLHEWGASVSIIVPERYGNLYSLTRRQADAAKKAGAKIYYPADSRRFPGIIRNTEFIIDALLGYNIKGDPKGRYAALISLANSSRKSTLAMDTPSGLNPDTGEPYNPCIRATATLSLGLVKSGLVEASARKFAGDLWVGDIGIPRAAYRKLGIRMPSSLFSKETAVRVL